MLRKLIILSLLIVTSLSSRGQSLFFECLKEGLWISEQKYDDPTFRTEWDIFLNKCATPIDSIDQSCTVWSFGDELELSYYNAKTRKGKPIKSYHYRLDPDKGRLIIELSEKELLTYEVGITSTGNTAGLYKMRRKEID